MQIKTIYLNLYEQDREKSFTFGPDPDVLTVSYLCRIVVRTVGNSFGSDSGKNCIGMSCVFLVIS